MKIIGLLILAFFMQLICFEVIASSYTDSLENLINTSDRADANRVKWLNLLAAELTNEDLPKALHYAEEAKSLSVVLDDDLGTLDAFSNLAWILHTMSDDEKANLMADSAILLSTEIGLDFYLKGARIAEENEMWNTAAGLIGNTGSLHYLLRNHDEALKYATKAVELFKKVGNRKGVGGSTTTIGNVKYRQGKYQEALDTFLNVLKIREDLVREG